MDTKKNNGDWSRSIGLLAVGIAIMILTVACNKSDDVEIEENCRELINPSLEKSDENTWYLASNGEKIIYFPIKSEGEKVMEIIEVGELKKYCQCGKGIFIDRYGNETFSDESRMMMYQLKEGDLGLDQESIQGIGGQDCIDFDAQQLKVSGNTIAYPDGTLFQFSSKKESKKALNIILKYGFRQVCYVGRPGPSFVYLTRY